MTILHVLVNCFVNHTDNDYNATGMSLRLRCCVAIIFAPQNLVMLVSAGSKILVSGTSNITLYKDSWPAVSNTCIHFFERTESQLLFAQCSDV